MENHERFIKRKRERDEQNEWMNEWLYGWMEKNEIKNCQNFFFRKNKKQTFLFECEIKKKYIVLFCCCDN